MLRRRAAVIGTVAVIGCAGSDGAVGPAGPAGAQGPPGAQGPAGPPGAAGAGTRAVYSGAVNASGSFAAPLPAAAGTMASPPAIACYLSDTGASAWLAVSSTAGNSAAPFCGLTAGAAGLVAVLTNAPVGWRAAIVVVY